MSSLESGERIELISTRHVQANAKFLRDYFDKICLSKTSEIFNDSRKNREFWRNLTHFTTGIERIQSKKPSYPASPRKTVIKPSPSSLKSIEFENFSDSLEDSVFLDSGFNDLSSPKFSQKHKQTQVACSSQINACQLASKPTHNELQEDGQHHSKTHPNYTTNHHDFVSFQEPTSFDQTSPDDFDSQLQADSNKQSKLLDRIRRDTFSAKKYSEFDQVANASHPLALGDFKMASSTPLKSQAASRFADLVDARIKTDANLTRKELKSVKEIFNHVSQQVGHDITANATVVVSKKTVDLPPGKYLMFRVKRIKNSE
jgi:hypothetical protein